MKCRTNQVYDGDETNLRLPALWRIVCCDCGAVHDLWIKGSKTGDGIAVFIEKDERASAQYRRHKRGNLFTKNKKWRIEEV